MDGLQPPFNWALYSSKVLEQVGTLTNKQSAFSWHAGNKDCAVFYCCSSFLGAIIKF